MSTTKTNLKDGWTTSEGYNKLCQSDEEVAETLDLLDLSEAASLLDNGCGNGELSVQAARNFPDLRIYGFDALESAVAEARSRASKMEIGNLVFELAWADDLPLPNVSVDRTLFRNVLHHIARPGEVFAEMGRCLTAGGRLVLQTPYNNRDDAFSEFLAEFHFEMDDSHRRFYYTLETIREDLSGCGFTVTTNSSGTYPFPFVTKRMRDIVLKHGFEDLLRLNQVGEGTWSVALHWVRLTAVMNGAQQAASSNADTQGA